MVLSDTEKAYLAGLFDSRCYIGIRQRNGSQEPQLEICRDEAVLQKVRQLIGGGVQPYRAGYRLRLRGSQVTRVLDAVRPWMLTTPELKMIKFTPPDEQAYNSTEHPLIMDEIGLIGQSNTGTE